ncbi:hypothetical protein HOU03_gp300 [Caulobacter phage CcrSC]|uniref:Uncharacterized protein n=1 Tax=Caulobacter phage CcrSC TaxID=2283272 RepID=A0A385EGE6_9CAUD|nr:hypothetical protein HOU03_gp300 [Caulobacter phage CcrSC]AXQ69968.1 hypothetical protein CcrSC_gp386 [Caulobacter phage CcrSC]
MLREIVLSNGRHWDNLSRQQKLMVHAMRRRGYVMFIHVADGIWVEPLYEGRKAVA